MLTRKIFPNGTPNADPKEQRRPRLPTGQGGVRAETLAHGRSSSFQKVLRKYREVAPEEGLSGCSRPHNINGRSDMKRSLQSGFSLVCNNKRIKTAHSSGEQFS